MAMVSENESIISSVNSKPLCSVCIANYNGADLLVECINSILSQHQFEETVEIIVHDDASTDNSVCLIQSCYPMVKLISSEHNVGYCKSNNRMVEAASGEYILLLNNDAVLHDRAMATLLSASQQYGPGIYGLPQYDAQTGELIDIGSLLDIFLNPIPNKDKAIQNVGMIIGACLWLPKSLWEAIGGFPEWFDSLAEDMYLCSMARLMGCPVKAVSQSGFNHWVGKSFGGGKVIDGKKLSTNIKRRALSERNKTYVLVISYPLILLLIFLPMHLLMLAVEGVILSMIKWDYSLWREIYHNCLKQLWRNKMRLLGKRQIAQALRKCPLKTFLAPIRCYHHKIAVYFRYGIPEIES